MVKSQHAIHFDRFQQSLKPFMKKAGFRTRGRTFNRTSPDNLIQVVNLQMGASDPPGTTYHPDLRENLHGLFTVNLGVYIPEVARIFSGKARNFVQEYHCSIRYRLGELVEPGTDSWWPIPAASEEMSDHIAALLDAQAFSFFRRFDTRDLVLSEWEEQNENTGTSAPPRLVRALILHERGELGPCRDLLQAQESDARAKHPHHADFVVELAERLGVEITSSSGSEP